MRFLFWNLNRRPLAATVARLARGLEIDVLVLAESDIFPGDLLGMLKSEKAPAFELTKSECQGVTVYTLFSSSHLVPIEETNRWSIRQLRLPGRSDILLVAAHLRSKLYRSPESQAAELIELSEAIRMNEDHVGHRRTILVGDLNSNPFEAGVVQANGLNAVMSREVAMRGERTIRSRRFPYFYNPMWGLFGDATMGPPGTYYHDRSDHVTYYWNMFDQVLIRPELLGSFDNESLRILESDGENSLLSSLGRPDSSRSDHLPILFEIRINRNEERP